MNRPRFLSLSAGAALASILPKRAYASGPSHSAWQSLHKQLGGRLIRVDFPLAGCVSDPQSQHCEVLFENLRNPFFIGDNPGLTQTLGWIDAWTTSPSQYAVAARDAHDVAAAVKFAREHGVRLAIRGGGHSYQGTSNAPDSLLIWTRHMNDIIVREDTVTLGAGVIWINAYDAVTTQRGKYVQGGGCTTVGVAGLIQSGGFGSFSKRFGTAAGSLLEAEVVTADGNVRIANAHTNPDLFWAIKGGGGGTFGVVTKVTLRLHDLPELFGGASARIKCQSDDAYRKLILQFLALYREHLFNEHWGEQVAFAPTNVLDVSMVFQGLSSPEAQAVWAPFFEWVRRSPDLYSFERQPFVAAGPARHWWDAAYMNSKLPGLFVHDERPVAKPNDVWWAGDSGQVGQVLYGYESLWLPQTLLAADKQERLADALFTASRRAEVALHFNKGLGGAPADALARASDTAMNPSVLSAFALAISADGQGPAYPGIAGHEPDVSAGRRSRRKIHECMNALRAVAADGGSYVSESDYFQNDWRQAYWGANYSRLAEVKRKYDPTNLFAVHHGVAP